MNKLFRLSSAILALMLAGCGGSPTAALTIADAQGIWRSATGTTDPISAIVLPDGTTWSYINNATNPTLFKGSLAVQANSLTGTGKSFKLTLPTSVADVTLSANVVGKTSLIGSIAATATTAVQAFDLSYQSRYDTAAKLTDFTSTVAAPWTGNFGTKVITWIVTEGPTGDTISGSNTDGCTYAGTFSLRPESKAVVDTTVNETCAGVVIQFTGVAMRSDTTTAGITTTKAAVLLTTTDQTKALALTLTQ